MTYETFRSKTPYVYNMYLKTFLICTFTQHVRHVNERTNDKQRYDSYGTLRLEMCCCENFGRIFHISDLDLVTAAVELCEPACRFFIQSEMTSCFLVAYVCCSVIGKLLLATIMTV